MKRFITKVITILAVCFTVFNMSVFADDVPITVYLDGEKLEFDVEPMLEDGRTLVPMRTIFEALGAEIIWDEKTWTVTAIRDDVSIHISIDDKKMYKNGELIELDVPARLVDSRTLVPARAVSEGMGAHVYWIEENSIISIVTDNHKILMGTIRGNTYENSSIGIGVELSDEWIYMNEEEIFKINNMAGSIIKESGIDFKSVAQYTDMMAYKESGENIIVATGPIGESSFLSEEDIANNLIESVKEKFSFLGEVEEVNVISRDFIGEKHYGLKIKYSIEGVNICCEEIIKKNGNYLTCVALTSSEENYGDKIFQLFYAVNK